MKKIVLSLLSILWISPLFSTTSPTGLLTNLLPKPEKCVITTSIPQFCWIPASSQNNDTQTAYEVDVSPQSDFSSFVWQSGEVESNQTLHIPYKGEPLQPNSTYWWRVRTWDKSGTLSEFSTPQQFNTGAFDTPRSWPGESRWVKLITGNDTIWTFEDREPISYHPTYPVKSVLQNGNRWFIDFRRSAFSNVKLTLKWEPLNSRIQTDTVWIHLGEKAVGDSIDRKPGGGVIFRRYPLVIHRGIHPYVINLPRFVPKYPHSQPMPSFMPEVMPFRFCEVICGDKEVSLISAEQMRLYYEFDETTSSFTSSHPLLNDIYDLCRYSIKANTFNGDYAASERERMMYEADCFIHQMGHYAVDREYAIARYSLVNMIYHATWPTEWNSHILLMAWADYEQTGDKEFLKRYYNEFKPKTLMALKEKNGLISTLTGLQTDEFRKSIHYKSDKLIDIVDWPQGTMSATLKGGETDNYDFKSEKKDEVNPSAIYNTVVNAFHYRSLVLMSRIAEAVGNKRDQYYYATEAKRTKKAINTLLFDSAKGIYVDGLGSKHSSLHANMFPLAFGLVDDSRKASVLAFVKSRGMACSVYGAHYLMEALFDHGGEEHAFALLTADTDRSWSNMLRVGATMTTEAWDNKYKSNNGWSHAWSSSPAHLIPRKLMGIEPIEPGFGQIRIAPRLSSLRQAKAKLPTIRGIVTATMEYDDSSFNYTVTLPPNTTARFVIPSLFMGGKVTLDGLPVLPQISSGGQKIIPNIGSGTHTVVIDL